MCIRDSSLCIDFHVYRHNNHSHSTQQPPVTFFVPKNETGGHGNVMLHAGRDFKRYYMTCWDRCTNAADNNLKGNEVRTLSKFFQAYDFS